MTGKLRIASLSLLLLTLFACGTEKEDKEYLQSAQEYYAKGQLRAATIELKNSLQQNSNQPEVRLLLAKIYLRIGDGKSAEKEVRRAMQLGTSPNALVVLAESLLIAGKHEELAELDAEVGLDSVDKAHLYAFQAEGKLRQRKLVEARTLIDNGLTSAPDNVRVKLAEAKYFLATAEKKKAQSQLKALTEQDESVSDAWLLRGDLAYQDQNYGEADNFYRRVMTLEESDLLTNKAFFAHVGDAYALMAQDKDEQVKPLVEKLLKVNAKHLVPNFLMALIHYRKQEYVSALESIQKIEGDIPLAHPATMLSGSINFALGNYEQADVLLTKFLTAVPSHEQARKILSMTRLRLNQPDRAFAALEDSLSDAVDDVQVLGMAGVSAVMMGDHAQGREYLLKAIKAGGNKAALSQGLAQSYVAQGQLRKAIEILQEHGGEENLQNTKVLRVLEKFKAKQLVEAEKLLHEFSGEHADNPVFPYLLGNLRASQNSLQEAEDLFREALKREAAFAPASLSLAILQQRQARIEDARETLQNALAKLPDHLGVMLSLSRLEASQNDPEEAVQWLEKARSAHAKAIEPRVFLARFYLRLGKGTELEAVMAELNSLSAEHPVVMHLGADVAVYKGDFEQALAGYRAVLGQTKGDPTPAVKMARLYLAQGNYGEARKAVEKAYAIRKDFIPAAIVNVSIDLAQNRLTQAKASLKKLSVTAKGYPAVQVLEGDLLMMEKKYEQALTQYTAASKRLPVVQTEVKRVRAALAGQQRDKAEEIAEQWLASHPEDSNMRLVLADIHRLKNDSSKLRDEYQRILKNDPKNVAALNNLAWEYMATDMERAMELAEKAFGLAENNPAVQDTYGWILARNGQLERARLLLNKAVEKLGQEADVIYHLAYVEAKLGNASSARSLLDKALAKGEFIERDNAVKLQQELK